MAIIKRPQITNVGKDVEKGNLCTLWEWKLVQSVWKFLKTRERTIIRSRSSTSGYISEENENINLKRYMHPNVNSSIIYSCQDMEAA